MAIQSKYGSGWRPLNPASTYVKIGAVGGGYWKPAGNIYRKIGNVGGGYWYNTGYLGVPVVPSYFQAVVTAHGQVTLYFGPPVVTSGGATPVSYTIRVSFSVYTYDHTGYSDTDGYNGVTFGQDPAISYTWRVQTVAAGGIGSPFTASVNVYQDKVK